MTTTSLSGNNTSAGSFNILKYVDKLEPAKEKGKYHCPVCQGHNLSVATNGAYQCWNGCECKDIREAIAPLLNYSDTASYDSSKNKPAQILKPPVPPTTDICLARLLAPATDTPQPKNDFDPNFGEIHKTTYIYSSTSDGKRQRWVERIDYLDSGQPEGRGKTFWQWHRDELGKAVAKKGDAVWEAYRINEFIQSLKATPGIPVGVVPEGKSALNYIAHAAYLVLVRKVQIGAKKSYSI